MVAGQAQRRQAGDVRRLERLHAITNHLRARSPQTVSAAALAERFGVSQRTIERDLRSLNEAGVPIYGVEGHGGGYAILPEHALPAMQLTAQEAAACVAALTLVEDSPIARHARTALDKLRTALPAPMLSAAELGDPLVAVRSGPRLSTAVWLDAIQDQVLVELTYRDDDYRRLVEPYTALQGGGAWYLIGWCRTRDGVRGFRTDTIRSLSATTTQFSPTHHEAVVRDLARWGTQPLT